MGYDLEELKRLEPYGALYMTEVGEEVDPDGPYITVGPHEGDHYEEMIAQFFLGNHTREYAEFFVKVANAFPEIVKDLEELRALKASLRLGQEGVVVKKAIAAIDNLREELVKIEGSL